MRGIKNNDNVSVRQVKNFNFNKKRSMLLQYGVLFMAMVVILSSSALGIVFNGNTNSFSIPNEGSISVEWVNASDVDGLKLYDDGGNGIYIADGGLVSIGTTTSAGELLLYDDDGDASLRIEATTNDPLFTLKNNENTWQWNILNGNLKLYDQTNAKTPFYIKNNTAHNWMILIDNNGVCFNDTSADGDIDVKGTAFIDDILHLDPRSGPPGCASEGMIYYDSAMHKVRVRTNTAWVNVTTA